MTPKWQIWQSQGTGIPDIALQNISKTNVGLHNEIKLRELGSQ